MTANSPNRDQPATKPVAGAQSGGKAAGAWGPQHGQRGPDEHRGDEARRCLDAIEENVGKLREAMSRSGRGGRDQAARGAGGQQAEETGSEAARNL